MPDQLPPPHPKAPMDLADLIDTSRIVLGARAKDKDQLLRDLAARAGSICGIDPHVILAALRAREALGSTGLGEGFALPHARVEGLDRLLGMFLRFARPIPYDAIDDQPVDLVFLLLIPATADNEHLAVLAAICRRQRDPLCAASLRRTTDPATVQAVLGGSPPHVC
jgi:PTS system nitrogen regulatory IIA component